MSDSHPVVELNGTDGPARTWGRRLRWFGAEFLVVASGVLVAIALNAWYQGRRDAATEATYLALLSRDVEHTMADLRGACPGRTPRGPGPAPSSCRA